MLRFEGVSGKLSNIGNISSGNAFSWSVSVRGEMITDVVCSDVSL
jgi:hypothetical protein